MQKTLLGEWKDILQNGSKPLQIWQRTDVYNSKHQTEKKPTIQLENKQKKKEHTIPFLHLRKYTGGAGEDKGGINGDEGRPDGVANTHYSVQMMGYRSVQLKPT